MRIETFTLGPLQTNAYVLSNTAEDGSERGIVIDPGMGPKKLLERIASMKVEAIVLTHAHFDHMAGVDVVRKAAGCPVYLHDAEADWLSDPKKNGSARWPDATPPITAEPAEYALDEGQRLELIGETFQVMHTPGHSPGSISLLCGSELFSGDVLFKMSVGRTDLPGGRERDLYQSIARLYELPESVNVYPGHGPRTTLGYEMRNNPYARKS